MEQQTEIQFSPIFDPKQMTFSEIEPSFAGEGKDLDNCIVVANQATGELLRILPNGEVIAASIEAASEAGRVFVATIRSCLKDLPIQG